MAASVGMAPGGVEPPLADSKFGPESRRGETNPDNPACPRAFLPDRRVRDLASSRVGLVAPPCPHETQPVRLPDARRGLRGGVWVAFSPLSSRHPGSQRGVSSSANALDDLDQLVHSVALMTGELDKLPRSLDDRTPLGRPRYRDATSTSELQQSLVPQ